MNTKKNLIFLLLLVSFLSVSAYSQDTKIKIPFSVLDENNNFFADLKKDDVQIRQGKQILQEISIKQKTAQSLDVAIMIDASISQERVLPLVKQSVKSFIDTVLRKNDRVAIVRFAGETSIEKSLTEDFAQAKEKADKIEINFPKDYVPGRNQRGITVSQIPTKPNADTKQAATSIWDSIKTTTQTAFDNKSGKSKIILLFTDGIDTFSENKLKDVIAFVAQAKIPVYAFGMGDEDFGGIAEEGLRKITTKIGGQLFTPNKFKEFGDIFKQIEQSSRSFYELSFTPNPDSKRDKLNELKIEIINPNLRRRKLQIIKPTGFFTSN